MGNVISIVIPSYNQGCFLAENIASVLSQWGTFYIDCIIVDGGSDSSSRDVIQGYENLLKLTSDVTPMQGLNFYVNTDKQESPVKCLGISYRWISEEDNGHGDALNKGFGLSRGNIMTWLNSDDKYHPGCLQCVSGVFDSFEDVNWLTGMTTVWDSSGEIMNQRHEYKNIYDFFFGRYSWIQQESTFWRRSLWEQSGAFITDRLQFMVDGELWCRYFLHDRLYHVDMPLGGYRLHDANRAHDNEDAVNGEMRRAIDRLRCSSPSRILRNYQTLRMIRRALWIFPSEKTFRAIWPGPYEQADYDTIVWEDGAWKKGKRPTGSSTRPRAASRNGVPGALASLQVAPSRPWGPFEDFYHNPVAECRKVYRRGDP